MYCLLCHEKISRLRAWRTKSEFCCDEHAEIYKRQTLERLLTDQEGGEAPEAPPLPFDTRHASAEAEEAEQRPAAASEALARFEELDNRTAGQREAGSEAESLDNSGNDEGLQELWRLAEEVSPAGAEADDDGWSSATARLSEESAEPEAGGEFGGLGSGLGGSLGGLGQGLGIGGVREQTPDEALAALRQLSGGARHSSQSLDDSSDELDTLLSARGLDSATDGELDLNAISGSFSGSFDEALGGEEALPPLDAAALEPLDDDELPSILERLTERSPEPEELDLAAPAVEELADGGPFADLTAALPAEGRSAAAPLEELAAELRPATAETGGKLREEIAELAQRSAAADAPQGQALSGEAAKEVDSQDSGSFDLIEEAVGSHLEEAQEPASQRGWSRKVVPFPLSRPKKPAREETDEPAPAASAGERSRGRLGNSAKAGKGMTADLSRLQVKPVAVMFGLEPTLQQPAGEDSAWLPASLGTQPGSAGIVEPLISYPDAGGGRPAGARPRVHARLFPLLPQVPDAEPPQEQGGHAAGPDYTLPCVTPLPLVARRNGKPGKPSVGSERAWMFQIEPMLAEGAEFEMQHANADRHAPWQFPQLPAALLSGVTPANGAGKLNLSGPEGNFGPPVDRLCLVFPELGELGGGVSRQSSSRAPADEMGRWMPPTVLDPRFDIERPAGRELSDFG
jgi:hypothetical protein